MAKKTSKMSRRMKTLAVVTAGLAAILSIYIAGLLMEPSSYDVNFNNKNTAPCLNHLFGTDWLGRDMLARTVKGLSTSITVGILASSVSAFMALSLGIASATLGSRVDAVITWLIDLFLSVPHMILIMLISISAGKGLKGVLIGIAVTHWTSLARVMRAEVMALKNQHYIGVSKAFGKSPFWIARKHILPHIIPQFIVGIVLLFPHAILHEAAITFLGFGLSPEIPAIGIILSESMKYLMAGMWWLAFFPGVMLLAIVMLFDAIGENLRMLINPSTVQN